MLQPKCVVSLATGPHHATVMGDQEQWHMPCVVLATPGPSRPITQFPLINPCLLRVTLSTHAG